jgi:hypothetical protein
MALHPVDEQPMAQFRALLGELSAHGDIADSQDLRALALGAAGHHSDDPLAAIDPIELVKEGPLPGDLLVRSAPAEGVEYLGVIVGDHIGTADAFAARGIAVESAGPGLFVEVAEVPFGGGAVSFSARQITDSWRRGPHGQTIYRPWRAGSAGVDDDGEDLFESEELARHATYESTTMVEAGPTVSRPTILTSAQLREAWASYDCAEERMTRLRLFGQWNTPVNPETVDAWRAFERTLLAAGYQPHRAWVYNCRQIAGQQTRSLHAYGLAIDIDHDEPTCNVNRPTPDGRPVRFSTAATKDERCHDVRRGVADTSFTPEQVEAVEAIQTVEGHQVFAWGGRWRTTKDTMHFQINVTPTELGRGIRLDAARGGPVRTAADAAETWTPEYSEATDESLVEGDDDYVIRGGRYTPEERQHAATDPSGLVLTSSVIGRFERRLTGRAPYPLSVSKEWARFGSGRLGDFVADYNEFTHYFGEVLAAIGRLQDLLSAGAPEMPNLMTSAQKHALRPTTDRPEDTDKKILYRQWRDEEAKYATSEGGVLRGLVFDVGSTAGRFEEQRHGFWQAAGELKRTIEDAKRLGKDKPTYEALDLSLSDALALVDPYALAAKAVDLVVDAYKKRQEYDAKMSEFVTRVGQANDEVKDRFEKLRDVEKSYWAALLRHRQAIRDRDRTRLEARQKAALLGQRLAPLGEKRPQVLAEVRMPILAADAWHALAVIGPPARAKLDKALKGRAVVEEASRKDLSWRPKITGGPPANPFAEITQIRLAWQRANSWSPVLTSEDIQEWAAVDKLWDEAFTKFNV